MPKGFYKRGKPRFHDGKHENKRDGNYNLRLVFTEEWRTTFEAVKVAAEKAGVSVPYMIRDVLHLYLVAGGTHRSFSECPRCLGEKVIEVSCPKCEGEGQVDFDARLDAKPAAKAPVKKKVVKKVARRRAPAKKRA